MSVRKIELCWMSEMALRRTSTVQQRRGEVNAALQYAAGFHCLVEEWRDCEEIDPKPTEKWVFVDFEKVEAWKHRAEWCAATSRCRCTRCERSK